MLKGKLNKMLLIGIFSFGMVLNNVSLANAATFGSQIDIEIKPSMLDVTVPSSAPFMFNEDGTTTVPSSWAVRNNSSISTIYLSKIVVDGTDSNWKVVTDDYDLKTMPVNTKNVRLRFGEKGDLKTISPIGSSKEGSVGEYVFNPNEISIYPSTSQVLDFEIERGSFTNTQASSKAFEMTLEYEFKS